MGKLNELRRKSRQNDFFLQLSFEKAQLLGLKSNLLRQLRDIIVLRGQLKAEADNLHKEREALKDLQEEKVLLVQERASLLGLLSNEQTKLDKQAINIEQRMRELKRLEDTIKSERAGVEKRLEEIDKIRQQIVREQITARAERRDAMELKSETLKLIRQLNRRKREVANAERALEKQRKLIEKERSQLHDKDVKLKQKAEQLEKKEKNIKKILRQLRRRK